MKLMYEPSNVPVKCNQCNKPRTNEPNYSPLDVVLNHKVGWYSHVEDHEEFCPDCMVKMLNEGNKTTIYAGW